MKLQTVLTRVVLPLACVALVVMGYRWYGWPGALLAISGLVLWLLMHFNRTLQVLKRAADRPIGHVDSAVMLNARLRKGVTLLHVVALTRSIGSLRSPEGAQPEVFRWTDGSDSHVTCSFAGGRLQEWVLERPAAEEGGAAAAPGGVPAGDAGALESEAGPANRPAPNPPENKESR